MCLARSAYCYCDEHLTVTRFFWRKHIKMLPLRFERFSSVLYEGGALWYPLRDVGLLAASSTQRHCDSSEPWGCCMSTPRKPISQRERNRRGARDDADAYGHRIGHAVEAGAGAHVVPVKVYGRGRREQEKYFCRDSAFFCRCRTGCGRVGFVELL
jgi:hypothetical protein